MIQSLKKLLELDVSLIAPSIYVGYPPFEKFKNKKAYQTIVENCISRLEKGETH